MSLLGGALEINLLSKFKSEKNILTVLCFFENQSERLCVLNARSITSIRRAMSTVDS